MIITIECQFCLIHFDERDVQFIGKYPNNKEACPDCFNQLDEEDSATDHALLEIVA